jgi:hypothetical protein
MDAILVVVQFGLVIICTVSGIVGVALLLEQGHPRARRGEIRCGSCAKWQAMEIGYGRCAITGKVCRAGKRACEARARNRSGFVEGRVLNKLSFVKGRSLPQPIPTRERAWSEYVTRAMSKVTKVSSLLDGMGIRYRLSGSICGVHTFTMLISAREKRTIHEFLRTMSRINTASESLEEAQILNPQIEFGV